MSYLWGRSWRGPSPQSCSVTCEEGAGVAPVPSHAVLPVGKELALSPVMQCYLWGRSWRCLQSPVMQCYLWGRSRRCPQSCSVTCGEGAGVAPVPSHAVLPVDKELALPQSPVMQCTCRILCGLPAHCRAMPKPGKRGKLGLIPSPELNVYT